MILPKPIYEILPYVYITIPPFILAVNIKNIFVWICSVIMMSMGYIIIKLRSKYRSEYKQAQLIKNARRKQNQTYNWYGTNKR